MKVAEAETSLLLTFTREQDSFFEARRSDHLRENAEAPQIKLRRHHLLQVTSSVKARCASELAELAISPVASLQKCIDNHAPRVWLVQRFSASISA